MYKLNVQTEIFYPKTMENYLSIIIRNHGYRDILEEIKWLNVQNAEQVFHRLERSGRWPDAQTNQEKECNWKSDFSTVQSARKHSAKY